MSANKTLTERFGGKVVKDFTGHMVNDYSDPQNVQEVLEKLDINFEDGTKLTISAKEVDITITIQRMVSPFHLGKEEPLEITAVKLVCE